MKHLSILVAVLFLSTAALAQAADASFTVGASFVSDVKQTFTPTVGPSLIDTIKTDHHIFLEGAVSVRMLNAHLASLSLEVPVAGIPSQNVGVGGLGSTVDHLSTVFVTPGFRLKLAPIAPISPWVSVGGGWAHYSLESTHGTTNKAALQYGGGLDFKTGLPLLGFRAEVRDFVTTDPNSLFTGPSLTFQQGLHHHNILAGGGIVLHF
jgi:hypothetical protein